MFEFGYWSPVLGYWLLKIGTWNLVINYLKIGIWDLIIGYLSIKESGWSLGFGYWLFNNKGVLICPNL